MDCDGKKTLKTVITNFCKLHMNKGKKYTFKNFKKFSVHKGIKKIDQNVVIKMFEKLKVKVHVANENGLNSLFKT